MIIDTLQTLFSRDLDKLQSEIELYKNEAKLWYFEKSIANSGGNLCLHLIGNLTTYIGVGIGKMNYTRQRDLEFSLKDIPRAELIKKIEETKIIVKNSLNNLSGNQMEDDFPMMIWEKPMSVEYALLHLATHLNYHLGQINYHRRLLDV